MSNFRLTRFLRGFIGIVSLAVLFCSPQTAAADDEAEIRASFAALQAALVARDADAALEQLSADTKDYYSLLFQIVVRNKKNEIDSLSPMNRIMVDAVKRFLPPETLRGKDPTLLLKISIGKGLTGNEIKRDISLNNVELKGEKASASLNSKGKQLPLRLGFNRENGKWKVNLVSLFEQANAMTEALLTRAHISKEAWVKATEARMTPPPGYEANSRGALKLKKPAKDAATQVRESSARSTSPTP